LVAREPQIVVARRADEAGYFEAVTTALAASKDGEPGQASRSTPIPSTGSPSTPAPSTPSSSPIEWSIGSLVIEQGRLVFDDRAFEPRPLELTINELAVSASGLGSEPGQAAQLTLSGKADGGESLTAEARLQLEPFMA